MSGFEWAALGLIVFGMVIPFWSMLILMAFVVRKGRAANTASNVHDYVKLMESITESFARANGRHDGPTMMAYLRELKEYPQYREPTLLFLESLSITGSGPFDLMCKKELKDLEIFLLGLKND